MSTAPRTQPRTTRTLRIRGHRLVATAAFVIVTPLTLAACGLLGGGTNHGAAPVEISQDGANQPPANGVDPGSSGGAAVTATQATTQLIVSGGATITRVGIRTQVNTEVRTQINTQVKTQVNTRVSTAPPVTNVVTVTATETKVVTTTETKVVTTTVPGTKAAA